MKKGKLLRKIVMASLGNGSSAGGGSTTTTKSRTDVSASSDVKSIRSGENPLRSKMRRRKKQQSKDQHQDDQHDQQQQKQEKKQKSISPKRGTTISLSSHFLKHGGGIGSPQDRNSQENQKHHQEGHGGQSNHRFHGTTRRRAKSSDDQSSTMSSRSAASSNYMDEPVTSSSQEHDGSVAMSSPDADEPSAKRRRKKPKPDYRKIARAAQALDDAGNALFSKGEYEKAMTSYTRALRLKRKTLKMGGSRDPEHTDNLLASVATSINNIGYLRQRSGANSHEIMAAYQDSLQIKQEILGDKDLSVGKTLNNIGSVYFTTSKLNDAMESYEKALEIMELNLGKSHLDVATVHSNIGDVHMARRDLESARQRYSEALKIRWSRLGDTDPKVIRLLEKIAAIEMADTPNKIRRTKLEQLSGNDDSDNEFFEPQVQRDLRSLRKEVRNDMVYVDRVKRELAIDMVKDKLKMIRGMRQLHDSERELVLKTPPRKSALVATDDGSVRSTPMTPTERSEALLSVKGRLARIRERRLSENGAIAAITACEVGSVAGISVAGSVLSNNTVELPQTPYRRLSTRSLPLDAITMTTSTPKEEDEEDDETRKAEKIKELKRRQEKLLNVRERLDRIRVQRTDSLGSCNGSTRDFRGRHATGNNSPRDNLSQYIESTK